MTSRTLQLAIHRDAPRRGSQGFTLIEVLVAMAIGLVILLALTVLFSNNSRNHGELERTGRQLESARFALDSLAGEMRHAGFYGEVNPNDLAPTWSDPDPCATNVANLGWNTAAMAPTLPIPIRGTPEGVALGCLDNRLAGTEAVTVRRVSTGDELPLASVTANNLYIQVSRCADDLLQIAAASTQAALPLKNLACTAAVDSVRRYVTRTYYIASCNDCAGAGDGIPTLKRVEFVNNGLRTTALAEGIENLQIEYGVDSDVTLDGRPDQYVTAAAITGVAPLVWTNVVAARIHLLSRNTERSGGYADARTYQLGQVTVVPDATAAAFKRTLMTETVRLFNVGDRYDQ